MFPSLYYVSAKSTKICTSQQAETFAGKVFNKELLTRSCFTDQQFWWKSMTMTIPSRPWIICRNCLDRLCDDWLLIFVSLGRATLYLKKKTIFFYQYAPLVGNFILFSKVPLCMYLTLYVPCRMTNIVSTMKYQ